MLARLWQHDARHEGVMRINLYLLRLLYALMFFMLGQTTWTEILTHQGQWAPTDAVAWTVWTAFATLAGSPAESTTYAFLGVLLAMIAVPWGHVAMTYLTWPSNAKTA